MKTLIIHHLQPMWENGYKMFNTSFDEMLENVYNHINEVGYDKIIITNFEAGMDLEDEQYPLNDFYNELQDYMYGWELNGQGFTDEEVEAIEDGQVVTDEYGTKWGQGGNHSEIVMVSDWMEDLDGEVFLCGAFDGECIEDMELALGHANVEFNRVESLIV